MGANLGVLEMKWAVVVGGQLRFKGVLVVVVVEED